MPTTSNFGWTTPADTDLVKDGAAAIRTLGNGVDTSFVDLKGGTTGQLLSKASNTDLDFSWSAPATAGALTKISVTPFTSVSAVSLANNSFTTTYNNYLAIVKITASSTNGYLTTKLRLSGTDATGSDYNYRGAQDLGAGVTANGTTNVNFGMFFGYYPSSADFLPTAYRLEIYNPKLAERTMQISESASSILDTTNKIVWCNNMGFHNVATAYDSMTIAASAGNITGTVTLYGYEV